MLDYMKPRNRRKKSKCWNICLS